MRRNILAWVFLFLATGLRGEVLEREVLPDGSEVRLIAPIEILPGGGFFPVRVEIENKGGEALAFTLEGAATLQVNGMYGFRGSYDDRGSMRSKFGLSCPAGEARIVDLLIPVNQRVGNDEQYLSLNLWDGEGRQILSSYVSNDEVNEHHIGISDDFLQQFRGEIETNWPVGNSYSSSPEDSIGGVDAGSLPEDWRAYAGYDALALTRLELEKLTPGARVALDQWARSGGHLICLNDGGLPGAGFEGESRVDGFGKRSVLECGEQYRAFKVEGLARLVRQRESLPLIHGREYRDYGWPVAMAMGSRSLQTGLLLFLLIIFAIVVGPVNLFVWANKSRRHRLFITTPVISIVTSVLLVGYLMLRDGFGGEGERAIAIEVGGPGDKSAVILQEQFSRSGILFSSGFAIDDASVLNPVSPPISDLNREDSSSSGGAFTLEMERTNGGWEISGDLFESRSEQAQLIRSVVPSREGLELVSVGGDGPELASSFSYALGPVFYTDGEGEVWMAESISPGEKVRLSRADLARKMEGLSAVISRFGVSHQKSLKIMLARQQSFAALADEAGGVATHTSMDWRKSAVLVTGLTVNK